MQKASYFGIALLFLIVFATSPHTSLASVDAQKVGLYAQALANLPQNASPLWQNIIAAKNAYTATFSFNDSDATRDAGFLEFYGYYEHIIDVMNESGTLSAYSMEQWPQLEAEAKKNGFAIDYPEGEVYAMIDNIYLMKSFIRYLSPAWVTYFPFAEKTERVFSDAAVMLSYEELYAALEQGEEILQDDPNFLMNDEVKKRLLTLMSAFISGSDNTPIYDYSTRDILPEAQHFFDRFMRDRQSSVFYPYVSAVYAYLEKNNFKVKDDYFSTLYTLRGHLPFSEPQQGNSPALQQSNTPVPQKGAAPQKSGLDIIKNIF